MFFFSSPKVYTTIKIGKYTVQNYIMNKNTLLWLLLVLLFYDQTIFELHIHENRYFNKKKTNYIIRNGKNLRRFLSMKMLKKKYIKFMILVLEASSCPKMLFFVI